MHLCALFAERNGDRCRPQLTRETSCLCAIRADLELSQNTLQIWARVWALKWLSSPVLPDPALRAYLSRHSRTHGPLKYTHDLAMEGNHGHHRAPRVCVSSHIVFFVDEMQAKVEKESPFKLVFSAACPLRRCTILIKRTDCLREQTTRDIQRYNVARTSAVCDKYCSDDTRLPKIRDALLAGVRDTHSAVRPRGSTG